MRLSGMLSAAIAFALSIAPAIGLEGVTVKQLANKTETASGQPITLPQKDVRVIVSTYEIAPGASLPVHKHPFPRYAYVQTGSIEVTFVNTNKNTTYKTGDVIIEVIDQWHHAKNIGDDAVKLLVIDQVEGNAPNTILHNHQ